VARIENGLQGTLGAHRDRLDIHESGPAAFHLFGGTLSLRRE
jgi:hypothetical protein